MTNQLGYVVIRQCLPKHSYLSWSHLSNGYGCEGISSML